VIIPQLTTNTVDIFKLRLDKFRKDQDVYYDFTCDMVGTGDNLRPPLPTIGGSQHPKFNRYYLENG